MRTLTDQINTKIEIKVPNKIDIALAEIKNGEVEEVSFAEFEKQINELKNAHSKV